jgi:hypothetical protein
VIFVVKRALVLIGGLILGGLLALLIGWVLVPMPRYTGGPETMRTDYQYEYIRLVAVSYTVNDDLDVARARLRQLNADTPAAPLINLTERWINDGRSADLIAPLARLARDMDAATPVMAPYLNRDEG